MQCRNSKNKISQGTSYIQLKRNSTEEQAMCIVKVAEEGFYMVPVIDRGYRTVA